VRVINFWSVTMEIDVAMGAITLLYRSRDNFN
jgi:hypothetical protein